mmetsp:Transcript_6880/g.8914  ORF Transcript_6880/g.8914 Transcript_6880/m.8914 type:complete len:279 (+) Transcript_6880:234-1070(+)|eukprot:CAMPEP_0198146986 /NCGR_PEP_ID=MMETSP1443-20131203/32603_1 /TAXON_ID=186043 /ORGANISM="Entomoneis sp., Strain CCMP2396" /LENGTH=278 /DNA_ID=CAMNT_0043811107 /DNA_START=228 /DNA_END=1064 /DNA_ORIENTATION=+
MRTSTRTASTQSRWSLVITLFCALASLVEGQPQDPYGDYNDYGGDYQEEYGDSYGGDGGGGEDNLYHNYAARQQEGGGGGAGGPGYAKLFFTGAFGWVAGAKFHSSRVLRKAKTKFQKEQKQLYSQYYNDVYKLTEQNQELQYMVEQYQEALKKTEAKHELDALQRDYDEFKQPDIDGDDKISRAEFAMYVKNYLSHYPGLTEADYPRFEDFDHDGDGFVSFQEYAQQMALQAQKAEKEALKTGGKSEKAQALSDMAYGSTQKQGKGASFEDVYKQYL